MAAYILLITAPDRSIKTVEITQSTALVGREAGDVIVSDPRCSSRHAEITFDGRTVRFRDLGSTNGTFSEGKRIQELVWQRGKSVEIGKHKLTLQDIRETEGAGRTMLAGQTAYVGPNAAVFRSDSSRSLLLTTLRQRLSGRRTIWAAAAVATVVLVAGGATWILQARGRNSPSSSLSAATDRETGSETIRVVTVAEPNNPVRVKGHVAETRVRVSPNTAGSVSVGITEEILNGAGDQWRTATWLAAFNATRTYGASLGNYDFNVYVRGHIEGPSAGMFMTVAMLALMHQQPLRADVTMTGSINPDGTAGPVGCILQKMQGAVDPKEVKDVKIRRFGFPVGTRQSPNCADKDGDIVDIVEEAQKLGLDARELTDVYDAYELATGVRLVRPEPVSDEAIAVSGQTQQMLQVKVQDWRARIHREIENHKKEQQLRLKRGEKPPSLDSAERMFSQAQRDQRNDYLASAVEGYADTAIEITLRNRFANAGERLTLAKKAEHAANLENADKELDGFCRQLVIRANGRKRGGQLSSTYGFTYYVYAQAMLGLAREAYDRLSTGGEIKDRGRDVAETYVFGEIAHEFLERARYIENLVGDGDEREPLAQSIIERIIASYASAANAALESFDVLVIARRAAEHGVSLDQERLRWKANNLDYAMALKAVELAQARGGGRCETSQMVRLAAAGQAFLWAATLLNTGYSLAGEKKADDAGSFTIANRKALSAQLDIARLNAKEAAGRAKKAAMYIPTAAQIAYQVAASRRDGSDDDKIKALQAYWESAFWSELAATP